MEQSVKQLFEKFETSRIQLLEDLQAYDQATLAALRSDGGWSIIQILNHLADAEAQSVKYMKYKLADKTALNRSGFKAAYRLFLLRIAFFLPLKYKVPRVLGEPTNALSLEETHIKWNTIRNDLRSIFDQLDRNMVNLELFKHPVVGKMNVIQAIKFMQSHFDRHRSQILQRIGSN